MNRRILILFSFTICQLTYGQFKVVDFHMHLWDMEKSAQSYFENIDSLDLSVEKVGGVTIARLGYIGQTQRDNDKVIGLSKKYSKLFPICSVHPYDGEHALEELRRLSELDVKVIKIHPLTQGLHVDDDRVVNLCKEAGNLNVHVLIDNANFLKPGDVESLLTLALKCPETTFIYAHLGALNFRSWNILKLIETVENFYNENIYFDISGTITLMSDSPIEDEFVWTLRNIGIDKILLGSDYPQWTLHETIRALNNLDLTKEEKAKIMYHNANYVLTK